MNPALIEIQLALTGAFRLARGDRSGLSCFVASVDGFWRSFRAAAICYPAYLVLLMLRSTGPRLMDAPLEGLVVETSAYVISWTAFPLVVAAVTRWLGYDRHFLRFMVAYNWCQVPQTALFLALAVLAKSGLLPVAASQVVDIVSAIAVLVFEWYVAKQALEAPGAYAALLVVIDVVLGSMLSSISDTLY